MMVYQIGLATSILILAAVLQRLLRLAIRPYWSSLKHLPSPKQGLFLFRLLHEPDVFEIENWLDNIPHQGLIRYLGQWNEERVLVVSPEAAKDLLAKEAYSFIKPSAQRHMAGNVGGYEGLLLLEGEKHKTVRKALGPVFRPDEIRRAYPIMWESACNLGNAIGADLHQQKVAIPSATAKPSRLLKLINAATIDTIGRWGFSTDVQAVKNPQGRIPRTYIGSLKSTRHGQKFLFWAFSLGPEFVMSLPMRATRILKALNKFGLDTAASIVEQREAAMSDVQLVNKDKDMLSTMIGSVRLSARDVVQQSAHMIAGGTETTASTMAWAIHLLSRHPDMQSRIRQEVRQDLPSLSTTTGNAAPSDLDFQKLKYLDAFMKEVLRYHSVNTILWREAVEPAEIVGATIPVGTKVLFSPWVSGRDPKLWGPDSRKFNPDRWLDDGQGKSDKAYAFLTFGGGPRRCPGDEYAKAQMRCLLAGLVGRFELLAESPMEGSDDGVEVGDPMAFTLFKVFDDSLQVNVKEIEGW